ncbi:MAG: AAA family ATPase [Geobacteraceae bacterium]|nr:AAA family ATPase [Geobacteraceae bacterium]
MKIDKQTVVERLRPNLQGLLQELKPDAKPAGKGKLLAHCLFPDNHTNGDANPSLLLFLDKGGYKCQACGEKGSIFDLYGLVHGLDFKQSLHALAERAGVEATTKLQQKVTGRYDYLNPDGSLGYYKERLEPARDGKRSKEFVIKGPNGKLGQPDNPLLYRLPELLRSTQGEMIIFTEGEKHVDLLSSWGLIATTLPHGSGSTWHDSYTAPLLGKQVVVLADNDEVGRRYAEMICQSLNGKAASLKIVELPGLPEKGDVIDWAVKLENNCTRLLEIIESAPQWLPITNNSPNRLTLRSGRELRAMDIKIEWLVEGVIPRNAVVLLYGRGGIGKTTLAMQLADAIDQGTTIFGMQTVNTQVIVVDYENSLAVLSERAKRTSVDGVLFCDSSLNPPSLDKADWEIYLQLLRQYPGALFIFDTLRSAHSGDENNSEAMALIMRRMRELRDAGATVILLHHTPKGNDRQFKGSGAIFDLCDQTLALYQTAKPGSDQEASDDDDDPDKTYRFGTGKKTRYRPHRVFLSFDGEREVFALAQNPDDVALESLHEIITNMSIVGCAKQSEIVRKASEVGGETFGGDKKIISLLKKGIGHYWTTEKGLHNSTIYRPIQCGSVAPPIESEKLPNRNLSQKNAEFCAETSDYLDWSEDPIDAEFGSFSDHFSQTAKLAYDDLPVF